MGSDTTDAQGLVWSPDGKWLVLWESPAHGHKVLFFTADGQLFKVWTGPSSPQPGASDFALGAGVRGVMFSPDARHLAIADSSRCVYVFDMGSVAEAFRLCHPSTVPLKDTIQVRNPLVHPSPVARWS